MYVFLEMNGEQVQRVSNNFCHDSKAHFQNQSKFEIKQTSSGKTKQSVKQTASAFTSTKCDNTPNENLRRKMGVVRTWKKCK